MFGIIESIINNFGNWILQLLYWLPGMLIGFTVHEFSHALAADRLGDPTPRMMGRLTLNPVAHIDPVGFITLIVAHFGWAKPVMTNPSRYKIKRYGFAIVGFAGPFSNLVLGIFFMTIYYLLAFNGLLIEDGPITMILYYAALVNFSLMAFNLIPIPPLDGYNILKDIVLVRFVRSQTLWSFERYGTLILLALIFIGPTSYIISAVTTFFFNTGFQLFTLIFGY